MRVLGNMEYENLFAGSVQPVVTESITVAASQELVLGQVVELDASGNAVAPSGETIDPTKAYGIMAAPVTTEAAETKESVVFLTGEFNQDKIIIPDGEDLADYKLALRKLGIFLKLAVKA